MRIRELVENLDGLLEIRGPDAPVRGLCYDSRRVRPGDLFAAWQGSRFDGKTYIRDALARGATALCMDEPIQTGDGVAFVLVRDVRTALADIARRFFGDPASGMTMAGVTGTNGKTTVSFLLHAVLSAAGLNPGLLGTVQYQIGSRGMASERTTPEAADLHKFLREMSDEGCKAAVMEVSSHALIQSRVRGIGFDAAVFTNLSPDHLDFHDDFESYFTAKALLFESLGPGAFAITNTDDPYGLRLASRTRAKVVSYGINSAADVRSSDIRSGPWGSDFTVHYPGGRAEISLALRGLFNIENALAAFAAGWSLGVGVETIQNTLRSFSEIPGRMQFLRVGRDYQVVVDYAHTEDALRKVLTALRPAASGRLVVVFGCGGDRDQSKRPRMGRAAAELADFIILTSDNPRSEDPDAIIAGIEEGLRGSGKAYERIVDRAGAIRSALERAHPGDLVLIAGKGHEKYQEIAGVRIPFDDVACAMEAAGSPVWASRSADL